MEIGKIENPKTLKNILNFPPVKLCKFHNVDQIYAAIHPVKRSVEECKKYYRSVFLCIWHCIFNADSTKILSSSVVLPHTCLQSFLKSQATIFSSFYFFSKYPGDFLCFDLFIMPFIFLSVYNSLSDRRCFTIL